MNPDGYDAFYAVFDRKYVKHFAIAALQASCDHVPDEASKPLYEVATQILAAFAEVPLLFYAGGAEYHQDSRGACC